MSISVAYYLALFIGTRFALMLGLQRLAIGAFRKINPKPIHPKQMAREGMWPLGLLMDGAFFILFSILGVVTFEGGHFFSALLVMIGAHALLVEPIYYYYHLLLHKPFLYNRYHIYHHKSVVVDPITSMSFTLAERFSYTVLFSIPAIVTYLFGIFDIWSVITYFLIFDTLNSLGHFNIPLESEIYKNSRVLKWLIYSPEYHEKHHSEFTSNYALFMPIWDKIFETLSASEKAEKLRSKP